MYDFCIELDDNAENLALIGETLGSRGVNINGLSLTKHEGRDVIHFVVDDAGIASRVLEDSGIKVSEVSEVFVLDKDRKKITGKPGNFGGICRALADHGIRIKYTHPLRGLNN
jgi:hypothetical protein